MTGPQGPISTVSSCALPPHYWSSDVSASAQLRVGSDHSGRFYVWVSIVPETRLKGNPSERNEARWPI
jgi:hypothetical protein